MVTRRRLSRTLIRLLARLPAVVIQNIEVASGVALGKGWGAATVREEVAACLAQHPGDSSGRGGVVAVDIGANVGTWTEGLLKARPQAKVFAFEPSGEAFEELSKKFSTTPNVRLVRAAVGNTNGSATLWADTPGSGLASLTKRKLDHMSIDFGHSENVDLVTLDEWCGFNKVEPTLIKIDVEGHELDVLKGGLNTLKGAKVVQFEFGGCNIDTRTYFQDFWYFFTELGFKLSRIAPGGLIEVSGYRELDETFRTTNYIAVATGEK